MTSTFSNMLRKYVQNNAVSEEKLLTILTIAAIYDRAEAHGSASHERAIQEADADIEEERGSD